MVTAHGMCLLQILLLDPAMNITRQTCIALAAILVCSSSLCGEEAPIDPIPRAVKTHLLRQWDFTTNTEGWTAENQCSLKVRDGVLQVESTGEDPYFHAPVDLDGGQVVVQLRIRSRSNRGGSVFWTSDQRPRRGEHQRSDFPMGNNGEWFETQTRFTAPGRLRDLRIDPGTLPGLIEIDWIRVVQEELHPLTVSRVHQDNGKVEFEITNHSEDTVDFRCADEPYSLSGKQSLTIQRRARGDNPLEQVAIKVVCPQWPDLLRRVWVLQPAAETSWLVRSLDDASMSVARDGSVAIIRRGDELLAAIGPLVTIDGTIPKMTLDQQEDTIRFRGEGVSVQLQASEREITVGIESQRPCEGPVIRVQGELEQGLFAGLEYLGKGEYSSSNLDIETPEHIRFAPDPMKVTMPLMSFVTPRGSVALTWDDMTLQPVYATPNFFDGTDDHRMTLQGKSIHATIRVAGDPLEESIAWAATRNGLPALPPKPRSKDQQRAICLTALNGPLRTADGWGHCVQARWQRHPYADMASTVWRLSGDLPDFSSYVMGGAHVPNGTVYFVTGQARQWLDAQRRQAANYIRNQQPDGSYHYRGKYARGHFEDTASGICALPAARLLEFAHVTGDREALQAGLRTLDYMKRFRTPRGAQTWEVPLHTPDQLASAYLVWAYTRGFELTGNREYLQQARKWALSGIPFTYLWSRYPIMMYATPPVYGATNWVAPNWMGLPVQWVGGVYAYALTLLAPHEPSVDWNHVARGILVSAQQQQYPEGPHAGLLPDSFNVQHQRRQPADINPCALVSLQMSLDGEVDFLRVARSGDHVVAAPFPVTIRDEAAHVQGRQGTAYQVLIDGQRIVDIKSDGKDVVTLD